VHHLPTTCRQGDDLAAGEHMLMGSYLAGLAFRRAGVGYVHAVAHQLGALYHVPHGLANATVLPRVLDYSRPSCTGRLADLARAADFDRIVGNAFAEAHGTYGVPRYLNHGAAHALLQSLAAN
jgi:alcohol dehydrogenase